MGQQDKHGKQRETHQQLGGADPNSTRRPDADSTAASSVGCTADSTIGSGASGEGAGSALEAMLKKRRQHIDPALEPVAPAAEQPPGGSREQPHRTGS